MKKLLYLLFIISIGLYGCKNSEENEGQSISINVKTPGTLTDLLNSGEKSTITNLTVTGTIDDRDVKCMRDEISNLEVVNLSAVIIVAYTGTDGTSDSKAVTTYAANEMPQFSFYNYDTQKTTIKAIILPKSITSLGDAAFYSCSKLTSILIPNTITKIDVQAFYYCTGLTGINIPKSVTSIGDIAFCGCTGITGITVENGNLNYSAKEGVLFNKNQTKIIQYPSGKIGEYTIPNTVDSIGDVAFGVSTGLTKLIIPNSVTAIGDYALRSCKSLTNLVIGNGVKSIGDYAFDECERLNSLIIGNSVISIGEYAFSECYLLTNITIPNSVTSIGNNSFAECRNLISATIGNSIKTMSASLFQDCPTMTTVTIPSSVTTIHQYAFYNCIGLTSVTIPSSVTDIEDNAFNRCVGLTSIYANSTIPVNLDSKSNVFTDVNKNTCILYVPTGTKTTYQAAIQWKEFLNIVEVI